MVSLAVGISAYNVDGGITWVPVGGNRVPDPDQVVDIVIVGETVIDESPKLLASSWTLSTPPEPLSFSLVKWSPKNWNTGRLELLELNGDSINIVNQESIVGVGGIGKSGGDVKVGGGSVETRPPSLLGSIVKTNWSTPMPTESDNTSTSSVGNGLVDISAGSATGSTRVSVVHKIHAENGWSLADIGGNPVEGSLILLSREDVLAVDVSKVLEESLGVRVGIRVDWSGRVLVGWSCSRWGQSNGIDEIPSPVVLEANGVRSRLQEHLSGRNGDPAGGSW